METQKKMKARLVAALAAVATLCAVVGAGCSTTTVTPEKRAAIRSEVADVMRFAYEVGGRSAYSNYVERLVADGKLTPEQAAQLHVVSQEVFDRLVDRLDGTSGTLSTGKEIVLPTTAGATTATEECKDCVDGGGDGTDCPNCKVK